MNYDYTNISLQSIKFDQYIFRGQMLGSEKAAFGRSKQKRNGSKLIGLSLSIDSLGFVRSSKFYTGNAGEPETFKDMLEDVVSQLKEIKEKLSKKGTLKKAEKVY